MWASTCGSLIETAFACAYRYPQLPLVCPRCEKSMQGSEFNTHAREAHGEPTPTVDQAVSRAWAAATTVLPTIRDARIDIRRKGWIQTFTGRAFYPLDPRPEDVEIEDVAHALSNCCRFTGHVREFYSVSQHSVLASTHIRDVYGVSTRIQLATLLHDASESYLVDVPKPIKPFLVGYEEIEALVQRAIGQKFGLTLEDFNGALVKAVDFRMLATEKRDLLGPEPQPWGELPEPFEAKILPWTPKEAKVAFLARFKELT